MNPTFTIDQTMTVTEDGENLTFVRVTLRVPREDGESVRHGTFKVGEIITVPVYEKD